MIECQIVSACETDIRGLGLDSNGDLTVGNWRAAGTDQYWLLSQGFSPSGVPLGVAIVNKLTGTALHGWTNGDDNYIDLVPADQLDQWSTWTFAGDHMVTGPWGHPEYDGNDAGYVAVRAFGDDNWNLNIKGGCANSDIIFWSWSGGARNEIWKFIPTGANSPEYFRLKSGCGDYLASDTSNQKVVIGPADDLAKWQIEVAIGDDGVYGTGAALGISIQNVGNGLYLNFDDHNEDDNGLVLADSSLGLMTWNFAPTGGWLAVRPDGDPDNNLNVKHGCGNTEVALYPWGGGELNEVWQLERV